MQPQYQREWLGQYPYPAYPDRPERRAVTADWPQGTGVASISRSSSAVAGVASASQRRAASISGASSSNRSSTCATAMHASSASVTVGGRPGPCRVKPREGMMRSVSST